MNDVWTYRKRRQLLSNILLILLVVLLHLIITRHRPVVVPVNVPLHHHHHHHKYGVYAFLPHYTTGSSNFRLKYSNHICKIEEYNSRYHRRIMMMIVDRNKNNNYNNNNNNSNTTLEDINVDDDDDRIAITTQRQPLIMNKEDDENENDDQDFSAWIVSNMKQWPLLNNNNNNNNIDAPSQSSSSSSSKQQQHQQQQQSSVVVQAGSSTTTTTTATTNTGNVWNDFAELLLQSSSTISAASLLLSSFKNVSSLSDTTITSTTSTTTYLRSPLLLSGFNFESILPVLLLTTTTPTTPNNTTMNQIMTTTIPSDNNTFAPNTNISTTSSSVVLSSNSPNFYTIGSIPDSILKQATAKIEAIVAEASTVVSSDTVMTLINKASELVRLSSSSSSSTSTSTSTIITKSPTIVEIEKGPNDNTAIDSLPPSIIRDSVTTYATSILRIADGLLRKGYVDGDLGAKNLLNGRESILKDVPIVIDSQALFNEYRSVKEINTVSNELIKAAEMGALAGAVYEDTIPRTHAIRQTLVARGTSADVTWMITDSIANHTSFTNTISFDTESRELPFVVRTITIRGFDASDESVDREQLLNQICTATPIQLWSSSSSKGQQQPPPPPQPQLQSILVHSGILNIARAIYADIKVYVDWTASSHKIVLNGHSIGGSVAILLLMLMIQDYGIDYVRKKIIQLYTFGSPPVAVMRDPAMNVLSALELPTSFIQGFVQPWDPVVRLFTVIDPLYPLVSDLGPDNTTPFANGPPRALRPLLKSILVSWAGWPRFRDNYKGTAKQIYTSIGIQHIILPEPTRYLADRFLAVNIPVPPIETILQISSDELYPALSSIFPLDVFEVSYVPQAIRSFVHHFYPAYGSPLVDYVKELQRRSRGLPERKIEFAFSAGGVPSATNTSTTSSTSDGRIDWGKATQWFTRYDSKS